MSNNGQMIMSNQNQQNMFPMNYNTPYNPQMMGMNPNMTPYNFNPGFNNQYNPMMNAQMIPQYNPYPPMYNPYNPTAPPLNNYNRMANPMTGNYGNMQPLNSVNPYNTPQFIPQNSMLHKNETSFNQPIKLMNINNTGNMSGLNTNRGNVIEEQQNTGKSRREQDKERIKRAASSKRSENDSSYISQKNSYLEHNTSKNGPSTNPESFSRVRNNSASRVRTNTDGSYKPYSLKDFKELSNTKVTLGSLGPNIGTKEWEEKMEKMRKMEEYSNNVNKLHQKYLKVKKETPQERIERERRQKNEQTNRHKASEYGKLVKPRQRLSGYYEERKDEDLKEMINFHRGNTSESNRNMRYNNEASTISYENNKDSKDDDEAKELQKLQNYREAYNKKIDEIKESFLKQV